MKIASLTFFFLILLSLLNAIGCQTVKTMVRHSSKCGKGFNEQGYRALDIDIMPLTEITTADNPQDGQIIKVYVSLLDAFDCQKKMPGVFRFELYQKVLRNAKPKGKRVAIWPDIDLTDEKKNNDHWRDFLRAYEFDLSFEANASNEFILQATCLCPSGKRLSTEFNLNQEE